MTHELVFRISSKDKGYLTSIKKDIIDEYIGGGTTQIISYSDDGLLEEGEGLRICRTKKEPCKEQEYPDTIEGILSEIKDLNTLIKNACIKKGMLKKSLTDKIEIL